MPSLWEIDAEERIALAMPWVNSRELAIDGGAHVGDWSRRLAVLFARVIAFEPAKDAFRWASSDKPSNVNLRRDALGDRVTMGCAVVESMKRPDTRSRFVICGEMAEYPRNRGGVNRLHSVGMTTVDAQETTGLGLLKLDVEGAEYHALLGARDSIAAFRPVVVIEESRKFAQRYGVGPGAARELLESWGYVAVAEAAPDVIFAPSERVKC